MFGQFEVDGAVQDNQLPIQIGFYNDKDESLKEPNNFVMPLNQEDDKQRTGILVTIDNLPFPSEGRYIIKILSESKVIGKLYIVAKTEE